MNSIGAVFRVEIFGESHGGCVGVLIDGCPPGIALSGSDFTADMARRRGGGKGSTPRREEDRPEISSGVFEGRTTGAPVLLTIANSQSDPSAYEDLRYTPRPGHADIAAWLKYGGFNDYRGGGHFSGRLTAGLVAAGVVAKKIIAPAEVKAVIEEAGGSREIERAVEAARKDGDSVGGIVTCVAKGVPAGLGEPFFDSVESAIAHAVFSIPAVKGIEFGAGFSSARMRGSECNDPIKDRGGATEKNDAGGILGGITNGNEVVFRAAFKPTPSVSKPGRTVDLRTGKQVEISVKGRHDACVAIRGAVVVEAVTAVALADLLLRASGSRVKTGG
jgi:chorismate synthase